MTIPEAVPVPLVCGCADPGCAAHLGISSCGGASDVTLRRIDMVDDIGTPFCALCADDAFASGLFVSLPLGDPDDEPPSHEAVQAALLVDALDAVGAGYETTGAGLVVTYMQDERCFGNALGEVFPSVCAALLAMEDEMTQVNEYDTGDTRAGWLRFYSRFKSGLVSAYACSCPKAIELR